MTRSSNQRKIGGAKRNVEFAHTETQGTGAMTGIHYLTDEKGRKLAVQIDLTKHRGLWEDIQDVLVSRSRRHEKRIPLDKVKVGLIKSGKLSR
jgi:hypothetical protein